MVMRAAAAADAVAVATDDAANQFRQYLTPEAVSSVYLALCCTCIDASSTPELTTTKFQCLGGQTHGAQHCGDCFGFDAFQVALSPIYVHI